MCRVLTATPLPAQQIAEGIRKFGMDVHHNYFLVALFDADDATVRTSYLQPGGCSHFLCFTRHTTHNPHAPTNRQIERLKGLVQGKETEVDQFKKHTVITKALQVLLLCAAPCPHSWHTHTSPTFTFAFHLLHQHYKISNDEKAMSDIVGSIVSRIATRGH
jgi:hypothetical protein